jgi:hypothetical protein
MSKTRYERRRDRFKNIMASCIALVVFFLVTLLLLGMACQAWCEHPAEQPISYEQHIARFQ